MNELVLTNGKGQDVTTSLIIAEVFEKEHNKVCRDIENLSCSGSFNAANFGVISYYDSMNRLQKAYELTKDGFSFLVMGYNGEKASQFKEKFILEFNKREALLKNDDYILGRALQISQRRMAELERANDMLVKDVIMLGEKTLTQQKTIEEQTPKVLFADCVQASDKSILVADLAKILKQNGIEIGQNRLFIWLRKQGYLCNKGQYYNRPTQKSMELGLFEVKETSISKPNGTIIINITPVITGKGQLYFVNKFLANKNN